MIGAAIREHLPRLRRELAHVYHAEGVDIWLSGQHQQFGGLTVDEMAEARRIDEVFAAVERLLTGAFSYPPTSGDSSARAFVDGRCMCGRCEARTTDTYRMVGHCRNCHVEVLILYRAGDPAADRDCPVCGNYGTVSADRLASEDEIPTTFTPSESGRSSDA